MRKIDSVPNVKQVCMRCCMCMVFCAPKSHMFSILEEKYHTA